VLSLTRLPTALSKRLQRNSINGTYPRRWVTAALDPTYVWPHIRPRFISLPALPRHPQRFAALII
jgi:hypothetical protein